MKFRFLFSTFLAVGFVALANPAVAQDFDAVEIRTEELAPGLFVLFGAGGNIGVSIGDDAVFLIDDQYAPLSPKILAAVGALTDRPIQFVLNTHWHFDHTGGNENMGEAGAFVVAHENVRRRMSQDQVIDFLQEEVPAAAPGALPVITFTDAMTFHINGDDLVISHVPHAHTDGDSFVHFRSANLVHAGDLFVRYGFPFVDVSSGGSVSGMVDALDQILAISNADTVIIPGHGEVSGRDDVQMVRDRIATVRDRVHALAGDGKTLDEIIAADPTAEFNAEWGEGWIKPADFIRFTYAEIEQD